MRKNFRRVILIPTHSVEIIPCQLNSLLLQAIIFFMLLTPHTFVGAALGASIPNPVIAVPLSIAMHFVGDIVPHWDFYSHTTKEERLRGWRPVAVMADLAIGVAVGLIPTLYALWVLNNPNMAVNIFLCGIGSVLPDALEAPYIFMNKDKGFLHWLARFQSKMQYQAALPWGLISQVVVILVSLVVLLNSIR